MSENIDRRVVEMQFDNKQFESNVKTTVSTLDKLKQSLNLSSAAKGLDDVNSAASKLNMSPLANGISAVTAKFSALQVIGITALSNITNSAVNAGKKIVAALSFDSIRDGFAEYETQMNAVQTILANTQKEHTNVKMVNSALDELNAYADKTIYNFTEMTRNIGTFTAAGVKLKTSISAIQGIANLAAISGSTSQQASVAMYQLSQALAAGKVQLMDWNSVVNAGMGGQVFQDALIRTSEHLKTGAKEAIKANGSFRESLTKTGWLTTKVLTQTLDQFATAADTQKEYQAAIKKFVGQGYTKEEAKQMADMARTAGNAATKVKTFTQLLDTLKEALGSGWTLTWRTIIGDFEDARTLWTDASEYFSDVINKSSDARNAVVKGWAKAGGRDMAIESIKNAFKGLLSILKPIKQAFRDVFPPFTAKKLLKITKSIHELTSQFGITKKQASQLRSVFKGLFSAIKIGITVIDSIMTVIVKVIKRIMKFSGGLLDATSSLGEWINGISKSITKSNVFGKAIKKITNILDEAISKIKEFIEYVKQKFDTPGFDAFFVVAEKIWSYVSKIVKVVGKALSSVIKELGNAFRNGDIKSLVDLINSGIFTTILLAIKEWIKGLKTFKGITSGLVDSVKDVLGVVGDSLKEWQKSIKSNIIKNIAISIGILAASLWVLSSIDKDKLASALTAMSACFAELVGSLKVLDKLSLDIKNTAKITSLMIGLSISILILASALKSISELDLAEIGKGIAGLAGVMAIAIGAMAALSKFASTSSKTFLLTKNGLFSAKNQANFVSMGVALIAIAASMKVFASAAKDFASLDWNEIAKGMAGIGTVLAEITGFFYLIKKVQPEKIVSTSIALIAIAASMKVFASAAKDFGNMDWEDLAKAGAAISGILLAVALFSKAMEQSQESIFCLDKNGLFKSGDKSLTSMGVALIAIAASMKIFASAAKDFASLDWKGIAKAGTAIAGILLSIAGFMHIIPDDAEMFKVGAGLIVIAASMKIFASAAKDFADMDWSDLAKAGVAMGGLLLMIGTFAKVLGSSKSTFKDSKNGIFSSTTKNSLLEMAAALLIIAVSMKVFASAMHSLEKLSWEGIAKGLITIGVAMGLLIAAAKTVTAGGLIPGLLSIGAAIALIGVGCVAAAAGITALAGMTTAVAAGIVATLRILIIGILKIIPDIVDVLTDIVVALCDVIIRSVPAISKAVKVTIIEIAKVIMECTPVVADCIMKFISDILVAIVKYTPSIVDSILQFVVAIIEGIAKNLPSIIQSVVDVIMALFSGVIDALNSIDPEILVKGILGIGFMSAMMVALAGMAALTGPAMVGVLGFGAVITELSVVLAAIGGLAQIPGLEWLVTEGGNLLQKVGTAIGQFIGGIAGGIAKGLSASLPDIGTNLSNFMANLKPFIEGAKQIQPSMLDGVKTLIAVIVAINAANIIDKITSIITGRSSIVQFANSLTDLGKGLASFSNEVKSIDISAVNSAAEAAKALAKMNDYIPNQGGLVSWIVGDNTLSDFAEGLKPLGTGLKEFSNEVSDIDPKSMNAAAEACKSLAKMNDYIPNQGGLVSWIVGDNTFSDFAEGLKPLGEGLSNFSDEVSDIKPKNISRAAEAGKALAEMADTIPNEGGIVAWFSGDNSVASFAEDLMPLGEGLSDFSNEVESIKPKAMNAAAEAAKALAEMADTIPNEGGVVSWFAGDNSIANFASNLTPLGEGLSDFSDEVRTIKPKNVEAAAKAGKALAEMADTIPNEGGVVSWFTGDNSISKFGKDLISLGNGLAGFSYEVEDVEPENIQAAANAAKALAEMVKELPKKGFWSKLFSSDADVEGFGEDLSVLGSAMSRFDESVSGIDANNIESAAKAAKSIADIKNKLSSDDDDNSDLSVLTEFANNLAPFGKAIYSFSYEVDGINVKKVKAAADAAVSLSSVLNNMPKISDEDGEKNTLNSLTKFINKLEPMGQGINDFNSDVEDINADKVKTAAEASLSLSKILNNLPKTKVKDKEANTLNSLTTFIKNLKPLGEGINDFNNSVEDIKTQKLEAAANVALTLSKIFNNLPKTQDENEEKEKSTLNSLTTFINKLQPLGQGISDFNVNVKDINVKKVKAASEAAIKIADIITKMPKTSDSQGEKSTLNSLTTFINKLKPLGVGIYDFNTEVKKIDDKKVTSAANAAIKMAGIIGKMPTNKVDDKNQQLPNLTNFTNKLQPLGTAIGEFNSGVSDINAKKVTAATDVAIKLADIISKMPETNTDTRHYGYINIQLQNLSSFTNKLQPLGEAIGDFNSGVSDINSKKVETAANVASTLTTLISEMPTAENDDKSYQLESLSSYTEKLQPLGEAIGEFNKGVSDIDGSRVVTAAKVASTLAGLIKEIPDDGKRAGEYSDRKLSGLKSFVDELKPLGTAIKGFNDNVGAIDKTNVTTATNIAVSLSDLIGQMPENYSSDDDNKKTGQLAALRDFISELEPLGEAIQKFNKKVGKIATDKVETAANAALTLSEIIPNVRSFSLPSDFTTFTNAGKSTPLECLTAFIKSLEPLGIAINTFNTNVKSINGKVSVDAAKVAVQLSTVINELPDSIKSSATELEEPFKKIGSAVKNFYDQSKNVKPTIVKNVASATKDLGQAVKNLPDGKKVSSFSDNISSLGTNMESFATTVMGIKTDELTDILNSFKTSVNSIVKAAKDGSSELSKAFDSKNSKDDLKSALNNLLKAGIDKISKYNSEFEKAGEALTSNLEKGMTSDSKKNSLSKNIKSVVGYALSAITTRYNSFKSAGSYLIEGLAVGLNDTNSSVYNAAYKLGERAAKGVKNGGQIKSPSKLTIESGHYLGKGLIVGMDQISNSVYKKGENLGHKTAMSITSAVANVVDTMNMDMDSQPTIRPVVDLSDVSSGVNSMNKMFGINPSIGVISNVRSISSSMNSNQNGNNMLLSAIDKLNDKMKSGDNVNVTVNVDYTSGENADEIANDIAASLQRAIRRGV